MQKFHLLVSFQIAIGCVHLWKGYQLTVESLITIMRIMMAVAKAVAMLAVNITKTASGSLQSAQTTVL